VRRDRSNHHKGNRQGRSDLASENHLSVVETDFHNTPKNNNSIPLSHLQNNRQQSIETGIVQPMPKAKPKCNRFLTQSFILGQHNLLCRLGSVGAVVKFRIDEQFGIILHIAPLFTFLAGNHQLGQCRSRSSKASLLSFSQRLTCRILWPAFLESGENRGHPGSRFPQPYCLRR